LTLLIITYMSTTARSHSSWKVAGAKYVAVIFGKFLLTRCDL